MASSWNCVLAGNHLLSAAVVRVENAMKPVLGVMAALVVVGIAALGPLTAQQLSSPPDHDQGTSAPAAPPSRVMTPWPDFEDSTTSIPTTDSPEASNARAPCEKPDAMGIARIVEIDTTGGPEFGLQHPKGHDFLRDKEVVLTFDDGPRPVSTVAVVKALQDECLKATFFEIGQPAIWHPELQNK